MCEVSCSSSFQFVLNKLLHEDIIMNEIVEEESVSGSSSQKIWDPSWYLGQKSSSRIIDPNILPRQFGICSKQNRSF